MLIKKSPMRQDNFKLDLIELKEGGRGKTHLHMVSNKIFFKKIDILKQLDTSYAKRLIEIDEDKKAIRLYVEQEIVICNNKFFFFNLNSL